MTAVDVPHPLSPELVELLSDRLTLLGDPTRIRILDALREGERNVQAIADGLMTTQQNVSGHLGRLRAASVVTRRSAGRQAIYVVTDDTVFQAFGAVLAGLQGRGRT